MASKFFAPFPPHLPPAELARRQARLRQAEWGVAVAQLSGHLPPARVLADLQRYIDGELTLEDVSALSHQPELSPAYQAMVTRARLSEQ